MLRTIHSLWWGYRLGSAKVETRLRAANELRLLRTPAAVARLSRAVLDPNERVRIAVIIALRDSQDRQAIGPLVEVLSDAGTNEKWTVWITAAEALGEYEAREAVEPIVSLFAPTARKPIPDEVHETALRVVGQIRDGRGVVVALSRLGSSRGKLPAPAQKCVREIGPAAIETLRAELLKRRWPSIAEMLALLDWKPSTSEERIIWALARAEYRPLAAEGAAAIEPMKQWALAHREDRRRLLPCFGEMPADAVGPALLELLGSDRFDDEEQRVLIELIGRKQFAAAVPALLGRLESRSESSLHNTIAGALIQIGAPSAAPVQDGLAAGTIDAKLAMKVLRHVGATRIGPELVSKLGHPDREIRRQARETLGALHWKPATPEETALLHISHDRWLAAVETGADVRQPIEWALQLATQSPAQELFQAAAKLRDRSFVEPLFQSVVRQKEPEAEWALDALAALGDVALPRLLSNLGSSYAPNVNAAVEVLAKIGEPAVAPLRAKLADPSLRGPATKALQKMGRLADKPEEAVQLLVAQGKFEAAGALGAISVAPLLRAWPDAEHGGREAIIRALVPIGGDAVKSHLLEVLKDYPSGNTLWGAAAEGIAQLGDRRALPHLMKVVERDYDSAMLRAMAALSKLKDAAAVPALIKHLNHYDPQTVSAAANALAAIGDRRAVQPLIQMLKRDTDSGLRWDDALACRAAAASVLGSFGDVSVIRPLLEAIHYYKDGPIFDAALASFKTLGAIAHEPLLAVLQEKQSDLPPAAVAALGQLDHPTIRWTLLAALQGAPAVRKMAAWTLPRTGWTPADDVERARIAISAQDFDEAAKIGVPAIEPLVQLIVSEDLWGKMAAATLAKMRGPGVAAALQQLLNHPTIEIGYAAVQALAACGDPRVLDILLEELAKPAIAQGIKDAIFGAVGKMGGSRAVQSLLTRLDVEPQNISLHLALRGLATTCPEVAAGLAQRLAYSRPTAERLAAMSLVPLLPPQQQTQILESQTKDAAATAQEAEHLAGQLAPSKATQDRLQILPLIRLLPLEQQCELLESLVDDPDEPVREAVLQLLESRMVSITCAALALQVCLRRIERGERHLSSDLDRILKDKPAELPTPLLRRVLNLCGYQATSTVYSYTQLDANNQDAGHVMNERTSSYRVDYDDAKRMAQAELTRRGE